MTARATTVSQIILSDVGKLATHAIMSPSSALHGFVVLLTFLTPCRPQFDFRDPQAIHDIVVDAAASTQCSCVAILRPKRGNPLEQSAIERLTLNLAKTFGFYGIRRRPTVTSYSTEYFEENYVRVRNSDTCIFWMTVVWVTNTTADQLAYLSTLYFFQEPFWLLFANTTDFSQLFRKVDVKLNTKLWVARSENRNMISLNQINMKRSTVSRKFFWTKGEEMKFAPFEDSSQMQGLQLRVGALEYMSYLMITRNSTGNVISISGLYGSIWKDLAEILKFETIYVEPADGKFGTIDDHGKWTGMYGMITRNEVDILVNDMTITPSRRIIVDFLYPIEKTKYKIFYKKNSEIFDWLKVFRPLDKKVWMALIIWIIVGGVASYIVIKIETRSQSSKQISLISCFYFLLRALSNQGSEQVPKFWALRIFFFTAYLLAAVILPSYSAALISVLTLKSPAEPIQQLTEIISTDFKIAVAGNTSDYDFFANSNDPTYQKIIETSISTDKRATASYASAIQYACSNPKSVFFGTLGELTTINRREKLPCTLVPLLSEVAPAYKTIAISRYSPYSKQLKINLLKMLQFGLVDRYRRVYIPEGHKNSQKTFIEIGIVDVGAVFIYFVILQAISLGIFGLELLSRKHYHISYID